MCNIKKYLREPTDNDSEHEVLKQKAQRNIRQLAIASKRYLPDATLVLLCFTTENVNLPLLYQPFISTTLHPHHLCSRLCCHLFHIPSQLLLRLLSLLCSIHALPTHETLSPSSIPRPQVLKSCVNGGKAPLWRMRRRRF